MVIDIWGTDEGLEQRISQGTAAVPEAEPRRD